ncbi:hypothetical protein Q8W25_03010 [Shimia thalassica]|uniref:hypothetical protein n=1 Tax=Shimia thalassica TaxID=1715693 RepID=UPI00273778CD|nr:hypothetical protein [Shimia thalassica]MDP2492965.1 hypothetical protein [Shimia thalassica]
MRKGLLIAALALALPTLGHARPDLERAGLGEAERLGEATIRWLGVPIYEAAVFTPKAQAFEWNAPMALELTYRRGFAKGQLLEATMKEIIRVEGTRSDTPALQTALADCYREVKPGDRVVAVSTSPDRLSLYQNSIRLCDLGFQNIQKRFLGIWLSGDSRIARLGPRLKGQ